MVILSEINEVIVTCFAKVTVTYRGISMDFKLTIFSDYI